MNIPAERSLAGLHVLVTGGARGIGEGIVVNALERDAIVSFVDIDVESAQALVTRLKDTYGPKIPVHFRACDITNFSQIEQVVHEFVSSAGPILGLVNNAGRNSYADPVEMTETQWDDFFALDLKASWLMCKALLPMMRAAHKGSIVQIASVHALMTFPQYFPYAAAKAGLIGLTNNLALDEGKYGIRVNAVSPGYTMTPMLREYFDLNPGTEERALAVHALGYIAEARDIANVVSFLLCDEARFVSGANWVVDGALTSRFAG